MSASEYDFILTRDELIDEAYRKVGILADGQNITSGQLDTANKKLNLILKAWSDDGIALWTYLTETITTVAGTTSYDVPTTNGMSYVESAFVIDGTTRRKMNRNSLYDYDRIYQPSVQGIPTDFSHNVKENKIYLYPVPNQVWNIELFGIKRLKDWESASSTGELPSTWQMAIKYSLATELAEDYKMPLSEVSYLRSIALNEYRKSRINETDISFTPFVKGAY
jgi:hypothetical protein